ncbi:GGDEF domain-containing protein [Acholeplasma vituli]|uniref:GGDEF domain-containing protein n=1 Tax=Paracholeplasma vituli TaxID=69473 RepID=A0ABT2PY35_9MOLU|nr:GGDEF domain-containing protein [Paracholeplasma vituli]MCU0104632.1 GGDEF domain-containing protein [Paracholeplasma vituli]
MQLFSNATNTLFLSLLFVIVPTTFVIVLYLGIRKLKKEHAIQKFDVLNDVVKLDEFIEYTEHRLKMHPDKCHLLGLLSLDDFDQLYEHLTEKHIQAYLQSVGKHIRMNLPKGGKLCQTKERETFLIYIPVLEDVPNIAALERIHKASSKRAYLDNQLKVVRASTLVYTLKTNENEKFSQLFSQLEDMLYYCKRQGGNTLTKFDPSIDLRSMNTVRYKEMKDAIKNKRFEFTFEPFYGFIDEKIYGSSVSIHYNDTSRKGLSITELILLLESSKDMVWFGKWLIEKAIEQSLNVYSAMHNESYYTVIPIGLQQLESNGFAHFMETLCLKYQIHPSKLILDLTNPRPSLYQNEFDQNLHLLKKMGMGLIIQVDANELVFKQHYQLIKPTILKYDISLIERLESQGWIKQFLQEFKSVVTNVTTKQHLEILKYYNITYVQGSFYGKKIDADDLLNIISLNRLS